MPRRIGKTDTKTWACTVLKKGVVLGYGDNRYRVTDYLASGGYGAVYEGICEKTGRHVAIKIYADKLSSDAFLVNKNRRIEHEGEILFRFRSPYLPKIYFMGKHEGRNYLVMELLEPLNDVGFYGLPCEKRAVKEFVLELIRSVAVLHRKRIVHCDIKPANIMRKMDGTVVMVDFGVAHAFDRARKKARQGCGDTLSIVTSPDGARRRIRIESRGYAAPEQGEAHTAALDIFAIGHVIRDCFADEVPSEWGKIINRCISNQPDCRYESLDFLRKDVEGLEEVKRRIYSHLRQERIGEQRENERSLARARFETVEWSNILQPVARASGEGQTVLQIKMKRSEPRHFIVREPLRLEENTILVIEGRGILEGDIEGPSSSTVVLRGYATFHNRSVELPPWNDLTYVIVGPGAYLNFPNLKPTDYKAFFPGRRRILRDIDATTSFRFGGPPTFSGVEEETLEAIRVSQMPEGYKKTLIDFFKGERFVDVMPTRP